MAIFKALSATYYAEFLLAVFINLIVAILNILIPFLITWIIEYISTPSGEDGGISFGIILFTSYILISCLSNLLTETTIFMQNIIGDKAYTALILLIYDKLLKITPSTNKEFDNGKIINFIQIDADRAEEIAWEFPKIANLPIQLLFGLIFLYYYFGYFLFPACVIGIVLFVINFYITLWSSSLQCKILERKDERMNTTSEIINNIKTVKLN